ncbi:MAG: cell division protein FtsA [Chloroflexi bacterium]|nr:cell division protein FtsA [Chloroflexota bacterium]
MANPNLYMAIDVGTTKVCTLIACVSPEGELQVLGTGVAASKGMRKGLVVDLEAMTATIRQSVSQASVFLDRETPQACVGITGKHIVSLHSRGVLEHLDGDQGRLITSQDLEVVTKHAHPKVGRSQQLLHVIPQWYGVDAMDGVRNPVGLKGRQLAVECHAVIGEVASLDNVIRAVEAAGVGVRSMVLEPLASAEAVLSAEEKETGAVLVDVGGGTSDLAIFSDGVLAYTTVLPVAGYQFTNDLAVACGVAYEVAEALKLQYGHALPDETDPNELVQIPGYQGEAPMVIRRRELCRTLNDRAVELLRLVLLKIREGGLERMPPGGVVFTGGAVNLPGWELLAREIIPGSVRIAAPKPISGLPEGLRSPTYSTSVGILLWGIRHPTEQRHYQQGNGSAPFAKGRMWLRWLAQFLGTKKQQAEEPRRAR